ncbi:MAG: hypothetical protein GX045_02225 [Clostridiaceae bacterium]|jgi:mannitol-specific phosphotransferase system IIBC component|nr:hypothetical protein [Clostridiaceae bacterium]
MQYLQRLPLLLALAGSLVSGILNLLCYRSNNEVLLHMVIAMAAFYIIGLFIRSTVLTIKTEVDEKREKQEAEEKVQKEKEQAEERSVEKEEEFLGKNIDLTVNYSSDDSFDPLPVSEFIRKQLKDN